ncbi:NAD(P)/FAD-dependent oxidoreductase [Arthrobacter wenxiniae]|jgi:D-amino-acid dehydrogenase|uniref:FAD-binding oxidoreductase n=1 Tax=Arthrobacter wenxiniae TaxID=2713570 RepID=A0A7Y7IHM5_9MICC|nr:FAD-binding oxidoreductase [Arthrobacter wenxiniae]NVM95646.1 FAD-binding oxidoreductase [Arthrobacter wenxiniae]
MTNQPETPRTALVVGAGIIGLSTAWHLQKRGVAVTVIDKEGPAAGASWGNAGWVTPGLVMPLAEPGAWKYAVQSITDPNAPLHVPLRLDPQLWKFLVRFAMNMNAKRWQKTMASLGPITRMVDESFAFMQANGIASPVLAAPYVAGFTNAKAAETFLAELEHLQDMGQNIGVSRINAERRPAILSSTVVQGVEMTGQSYLDPGEFVGDLARDFKSRGGQILEGTCASAIDAGLATAEVSTDDGRTIQADVVVLATGAWLHGLAKKWGLKIGVQAGRGYSFTVDGDRLPAGPLYFPEQRVVCTPYQGALRIAGTMEFLRPDEPMNTSRLDSVVRAVRPLLQGIDWSSRRDEWVGSRPVTPDGLPVVGRLAPPRIYAAGGHGMWGMVLGPATGQLLAEQIMTGTIPPEIRDFDPLRP